MRGIEYMKKEIIFMPNEIFTDLQKNIELPTNVAFAYAYYYYISYLYRYCKYDINSNSMINVKDIKKKLGYSPINKKIDYLIKKDGVLDEIGYTESVTDFPVAWELTKYSSPIFTYISEYKKAYPEMFKKNEISYIEIPANFKVKKPIKAFYRTKDSNSVDGTFYEPFSTHSITYDIFDYFMESEELGVIAFYLYGYFKFKSETCGGQYSASYLQLKIETGLSTTTLQKYIFILERNAFLEVDHKEYVHKGYEYMAKNDDNYPMMPNVYKTL
jgi:hypothetical protein